MTTKITKMDALTFVLEHYDLPVEYAEKIQGMIDALGKKSSRGERKLTEADVALRAEILEILKLADGHALTIAEIRHLLSDKTLTSQKVTGQIRDMAEVKAEKGKRGMVYFLPVEV